MKDQGLHFILMYLHDYKTDFYRHAILFKEAVFRKYGLRSSLGQLPPAPASLNACFIRVSCTLNRVSYKQNY